MPGTDIGNGLNEAVLADRDDDALGGTGGSSGGGTIAGSGDPAGGTLDEQRGVRMEHAGAAPGDAEIAEEAGALGPADGSLADALSGGRDPNAGASIGESLGGAGRADAGSGTPGDRGELGGGDPMRDGTA